jgi:hypothetical protein
VYGVVFFDGMFAMFDGAGCIELGVLAVVSGIIVLVFARQRVHAR